MTSLIINANSSDFTVEFNSPIDLRDGRYEIGLEKLAVWNSWYNICEKFKNNKFGFAKQSSTGYGDFTIPDGNYTVDDLNAYFEAVGIDLKIEVASALSRFELVPGEGCAVDLREGDLYKLLGFDPAVYTGRQLAQHVGNITRDVDVLLVHCDIVVSSRINSDETQVLYAFVPKSPPGALISIDEITPIYQSVVHTSELRRLRIWVTDQDDRPVDFNGQRAVYTLVLKKAL